MMYLKMNWVLYIVKKLTSTLILLCHQKFLRSDSYYAMKGKVKAELQHLQDQGIISPLKYSMWAVPVVPVLKQDKKTENMW